MKTAERKSADHIVIDLTRTPYFTERPLVLEEASSQERLRADTGEFIVIPDYKVDRRPAVAEPGVRYGGGLGLATVLDVRAHPVRAQVRRIHWVAILASSLIASVGVLMILFAALRY